MIEPPNTIEDIVRELERRVRELTAWRSEAVERWKRTNATGDDRYSLRLGAAIDELGGLKDWIEKRGRDPHLSDAIDGFVIATMHTEKAIKYKQSALVYDPNLYGLISIVATHVGSVATVFVSREASQSQLHWLRGFFASHV